ncbi:hypothetical protein CLV62_10316 [Dysgonomonas alginatilytica]|uniref:Uncharacterized protein n=1 Tax=Dysgonomonas alginatilytica TaxID=1605892 RepID=A0A2V3PRD5_9BACT|nr:hypothetical protein CLV62_10316 [Dysgonomonas alginatilytica]
MNMKEENITERKENMSIIKSKNTDKIMKNQSKFK